MATWAITGAAGYVGTRVLERLLADPRTEAVIAIDVAAPQLRDPRVVSHALDVRDPRLADVLRGRGIDALLHLAFVVDPLYDERLMADVNLGGTRNVLAAVEAAGIGRLVATSSTSAYGALPDNPMPLREEHPLRATPRFAYGYDKRRMDGLLQAFQAAHPETAVCVLRPCIVLGPTVANYASWTMLAQPAVTLLDGRDVPLQFIHEDDLVALVVRCLTAGARGVYNAVGRDVVGLRDAAAIAGKRVVRVPYPVAAAGVWLAWRLRLTPFALAPGFLDLFRWPWVASGEKAARELGFEPRHTSADAFAAVATRRADVRAASWRRVRARRGAYS